MNESKEQTKNNHYVPQFYLKNWESSKMKVWVYRRLVSHENVPLWVEKSIKGVAYHQHLYTRKILGKENDKIEKWLERDYESPGRESIQKVITNQRLYTDDWEKIIRFFALQQLRTPKSFLQHLEFTKKTTPAILENILQDLPAELAKLAQQRGDHKNIEMPEFNKDFPLRIKKTLKPGEENGTLEVFHDIGRASWIWEIKDSLKTTAKILHNHKWTIICPAKGMYWPTSDNPVIRLNYHSSGKYDFDGGWGRKNGELLLPLSPWHLLYTKIGDRSPLEKYKCASIKITHQIRRFIAENSLRMIFSCFEDSEIPNIVPRKTDAEMVKNEKKQWDNFNEEHSKSEEYMLGSRK